ncbi:MAG TPA: alpha/beta hydrolase [Rhizomicrobium sp.]|jgi:pimeloyl-ACP methyl ester carboxylesterase
MSGSPVVMVHGAFCGGWAFDGWRPLFERRGFEVHSPNLRHHEPRTRDEDALGGTSLRDYASDLAGLLDRIDPWPIVIGHSLGGLLAQMLAAMRPVRALVLLAPSPPWGLLPSTPFEFFSAQALFFEGAFWHKPLAPRRWIAEANALDLIPEAGRDAILERLVPESGRAMFEVMHWMLDGGRASHVDARAVACPILCLAGAQDRVSPPATVKRIARRYGGRARYEELPAHSHWLIGEPRWEKIARGALSWLDRVADRDEERTTSGT